VSPPTISNLIDGTDHLVCFGIRLVSPTTFVPPTVFDGNQFGTGQVTVKSVSQLCVPSLKSVPPAGLLSAPSAANEQSLSASLVDSVRAPASRALTLALVGGLAVFALSFALPRRRLSRGRKLH
jgi:hypothetical protein